MLCRHYSDAADLPPVPWPAGSSASTVLPDDEASVALLLEQLKPPANSFLSSAQDCNAHMEGPSCSTEHTVTFEDVVATLRLEDAHAALRAEPEWHPHLVRQHAAAPPHSLHPQTPHCTTNQQQLLQADREICAIHNDINPQLDNDEDQHRSRCEAVIQSGVLTTANAAPVLVGRIQDSTVMDTTHYAAVSEPVSQAIAGNGAPQIYVL